MKTFLSAHGVNERVWDSGWQFSPPEQGCNCCNGFMHPFRDNFGSFLVYGCTAFHRYTTTSFLSFTLNRQRQVARA